ncbi:hypothetical protein HN873_052599 [Arachis hypogaea]|uniref:Dirigent protein n=1 Tax=Arachis hypogaea TaxID=3818 RepID=A0A444Z0P6_ARAHY|nr:Dirigent protein [Arachis hypogaea]RYR07777.1 hypothetical protein Ahy_B05g075217 [Arachis hypogaea]
MLPPRYIFFIAVSLATIAVILLALLSPVSHTTNNPTKPWLDLSMYIQQQHQHVASTEDQASSLGGAFMYHGFLTEGPENTSRVVGKAQGFIIIPTSNNVEQFQQYYYYDSSAFNVMYLTFDTPEHSGSLSVQAKEEVSPQKSNNKGRRREELRVVGGTDSFAFARGIAVISQTGGGQSSHENGVTASYHVKLQLQFPKHSSNKFLP